MDTRRATTGTDRRRVTEHDEHLRRPRPVEALAVEESPPARTPAARGMRAAAGPAQEVSHRRRDRDHRGPRRPVRVLLRLTEDQAVALEEAARAAGLTPSGYAAEAAVAAAAGARPPAAEPLRAALGDLIEVRAQLRRLGTNVHLAVKAFHQAGEPPSWLRAAIEDASRAVTRVDQAADALVRELR